MHALDTSQGCRLIGIGVSNLSSTIKDAKQLILFGDEKKKSKSWEKADKAIDIIKERFGNNAITRGVVLKKDP